MAKLKVLSTSGKACKTQVLLDDRDITSMLRGIDISIHAGSIVTATLTLHAEVEFDGVADIVANQPV